MPAREPSVEQSFGELSTARGTSRPPRAPGRATTTTGLLDDHRPDHAGLEVAGSVSAAGAKRIVSLIRISIVRCIFAGSPARPYGVDFVDAFGGACACACGSLCATAEGDASGTASRTGTILIGSRDRRGGADILERGKPHP